MMRLIDSDALLEDGIRVQCGYNADGLLMIPMRDVTRSIKNAPTVEAVILPPVKVGDTAYFIVGGKVYKAEVYFVRWEEHKLYGIHSEITASIVPNYSVGASFDDFGKTVFLTEEEAEAALDRMKGVIKNETYL